MTWCYCRTCPVGLPENRDGTKPHCPMCSEPMTGERMAPPQMPAFDPHLDPAWLHATHFANHNANDVTIHGYPPANHHQSTPGRVTLTIRGHA